MFKDQEENYRKDLGLPPEQYNVIFLVDDLKNDLINKYLVVNTSNFCVKIPFKKKANVSSIRCFYDEEVKPLCEKHQVKYIVACNSDVYKALAKTTKAENDLGYIKSIDNYKLIYCPNLKKLYFDSYKTKEDIKLVMDTINNDLNNNYTELGKDIIHSAQYPIYPDEVKKALDDLKNYGMLTCDIETYSLKHYNAGIASIAFAWDEHNGIAIPVDINSTTRDEQTRALLKEFLETYNGKLIFHNAAFDLTVLVYQLYMKYISDNQGLYEGLEKLVKVNKFEDTKLITYLATNSCSDNVLNLKTLAHSFAGNYAKEEIGNVEAISKDELLKYNLTDCLSTWFVFNKYQPQMIRDEQEDVYQFFKQITHEIIHMQLTGLPVDMDRVIEVKKELNDFDADILNKIQASPIVKEFTQFLNEQWVTEKNGIFKKKRVTIEDAHEVFNPDSHLQLRELLYKKLKLPILSKTKKKLAATGQEDIKELLNHTDNNEVKDLLNNLIEHCQVIKIITSFIPALEKAVYDVKTNCWYLFGSQVLGGTVSGRLSSKEPNLANLPATGTKYAKIIKSCFIAPKGWILCGIDFWQLEERIASLTTKDPNKLKVYIEGYDSHSLRAYAYDPDSMPDITQELKEHPENELQIINSIKEKHKDLRSKYKACTFALNYQGSYRTLMKTFGFKEKKAKTIEANFHKLYADTDKWVNNKLQDATNKGYVTGAFGLKLRTPAMYRSVLNTKATPLEVEEERKTAANMLWQSYGLLCSRAGIEINNKIKELHLEDKVKPINQIHDALYFIVKDDIDIILKLNEIVTKAFSWQELPELQHDIVKLGGDLSLFYPNWGNKEYQLPQKCTEEELKELVKE